jgi:hypothetical protein
LKTGRLVWVAPALLLLASGDLSAQDSVDSRLQKLEETIRVLERRVASLEGQLQGRKAPLGVPSGKANWRQLQKGMSEGDVEQLLGSPSKVDVYGSFTVWHYGYPSGGAVHFDGDTRTVESWHEP